MYICKYSSIFHFIMKIIISSFAVARQMKFPHRRSEEAKERGWGLCAGFLWGTPNASKRSPPRTARRGAGQYNDRILKKSSIFNTVNTRTSNTRNIASRDLSHVSQVKIVAVRRTHNLSVPTSTCISDRRYISDLHFTFGVFHTSILLLSPFQISIRLRIFLFLISIRFSV